MLNVRDLAKEFTIHILGGKRIFACRGISFSVRAGEALGITGPSGAGKSSILKCIYRTYRPTRGEIWYRAPGKEPIDLAALSDTAMLRVRSCGIGYVSQFLHVVPRVTTVDVVAEPLLRRGIAREAARREARSLLERLRIPPALFDAYPVTFSGGEQQRVNIARAVIARPKLLLLDEPTASLDSESAGIILEILSELKAGGTAMVAVFHDRAALERFADRVYQLAVSNAISLSPPEEMPCLHPCAVISPSPTS